MRAAIDLQPCMIGGLFAECGTYLVYEDRITRAGRQISLRVAIVRARDPNPAPEPMVYLSGGPGGAATEDAPGIGPAFTALNARHDWLLVDQRGTGGANRLLYPPPPPELTRMDLTPEQVAAVLQDWKPEALKALDGDPRFYTTAVAMDDLDEVRAALGYDRVNLYGGSYGVTAALYYLRRHGDHVRTVILDGGTLLDVPIFERIAATSQRALDLVLARCEADARCQAQFPDVRAEFQAVTERLGREPVTLDTIMSPFTHEPLVFDSIVWGATVHAHLMSATSAAALPRRIHQAYNGDYRALAELYQQLGLVVDTNARLVMSAAIRCSESWARYDPAEVARWGADSYYLESQLAQARMQAAACTFVPPGFVYPDDAAPVRSDVPVLLLTGEADPQNPPEHVASAARDLPNSLRITVPGHGHGVIQYGCLPQIAATFVDRGTVADLDTSCVQDVFLPAFDTRD
jgi:pimeloyl-ACP methyl ester carboxylesterase